MAARLTIRERPATAAELARIDKAEARDWRSMGLLLSPAALAVYLAFVDGSFGAAAILGVPALLGVFACFGTRRYMRENRWRLERDVAAAIVQELELSAAEPFQIPGHHSSVEPAFAFECEGEQTVVLLGQYLLNSTTYGAPADAAGAEDDYDEEAGGNGLPSPFTWPADRFTIHRFPISGRVIRIEVQGDAVAQLKTAHAVLNAINHHECALLPCRLADLQTAADDMAEREQAEFEQACRRRTG